MYEQEASVYVLHSKNKQKTQRLSDEFSHSFNTLSWL